MARSGRRRARRQVGDKLAGLSPRSAHLALTGQVSGLSRRRAATPIRRLTIQNVEERIRYFVAETSGGARALRRKVGQNTTAARAGAYLTTLMTQRSMSDDLLAVGKRDERGQRPPPHVWRSPGAITARWERRMTSGAPGQFALGPFALSATPSA